MLLSGADLLSLPPPQWLVRRFLLRGATGMLYGPSYTGKTFVALDMALHIACGIRWADLEVSRSAVVYLAGEGTAGMSQRVQAWCALYGMPMGLLDSTFFYLKAAPLQVVVIRDGIVEQVRAKLDGRECGLVVVDTYARYTAGLDENRTVDIHIALDALDDMRARIGGDPSILIVHHEGWPRQEGKGAPQRTKRMRGGSALFAAMDTVIPLCGAGRGLADLGVEKLKDGRQQATMRVELLTMDLGADPEGDGRLESAAASVSRELDPASPEATADVERRAQGLLAVLAGNPNGLSTASWQRAGLASGISRAAFYRMRPALIGMGAVEVVGGDLNVVTGRELPISPTARSLPGAARIIGTRGLMMMGLSLRPADATDSDGE